MDMKHKLLYLSAAEADILAIVKFHADKVGAVSAREIYKTIRREIGRLQEFPLLGQLHPDPDLAALGYRKLVLNRTYVAIYIVNDKINFTKNYKETLTVDLAWPMQGMRYQRYFPT